MAHQEDLKLAFVIIEHFESGSVIRGALMITDIDTKPYEFRVTGPVRPTPIQRILYGGTLDEYVQIDLIGLPLLKAAKEALSLVLVDNPFMLRLRPQLSAPVVCLRRDSSATSKTQTESESAPFSAITMVSHREFPTESATAQAMLSSVIQKRDYLEPFERLRVALAEANKAKVGE